MQPLTATHIVTIWEQGQRLHPIDRALLMLACALPDASAGELRQLTLGQRNGRLLRLRQLTLGDRLEGLIECPQCHTTLEFSVSTDQLLVPEPQATTHTITAGDHHFRLRLPTSADLAALVNSTAVEAARTQLFARCVQLADGTPLPDHLPANVVAAIADFMAEADPQADMRFGMSCPDCGNSWQALFDIAAFFWSELSAQARRLLQEVHQLARAYGWRESEVLAMSSLRRHTYLEMIAA